MYAKAYLYQLEFGTKERTDVITDLITKMTAGHQLTINEEEYLCLQLRSFRTNTGEPFPVHQFNRLAIGCFIYAYLTHYKDIECYTPVYRNNSLIPPDECDYNRQLLSAEAFQWSHQIENAPQGDEFMGHLRKEVRHQLKEIKKYAAVAGFGHFRRKYLEKNTILHSKFVFLRVKGFFQEYGSDRISFQLFNQIIIIDGFFFVHVLFRHYAPSIKEHQQQKSYHIENFDYTQLPLEIEKIIKMYGQYVEAQMFNMKEIPFLYNNRLYNLYFRQVSRNINGANVSCLRLQTFYPVEVLKDLDRLNGLSRIPATDGIEFLVT